MKVIFRFGFESVSSIIMKKNAFIFDQIKFVITSQINTTPINSKVIDFINNRVRFQGQYFGKYLTIMILPSLNCKNYDNKYVPWLVKYLLPFPMSCLSFFVKPVTFDE